MLPSQQVNTGTEPLLVAATDAAAENGSYWGPTGRFGLVGEPGRARLPRAARDAGLAARFWVAAEGLTGVSLPVGASGL